MGFFFTDLHLVLLSLNYLPFQCSITCKKVNEIEMLNVFFVLSPPFPIKTGMQWGLVMPNTLKNKKNVLQRQKGQNFEA